MNEQLKILYWSDSYAPSRSANLIQVLKMCNAIAKHGYLLTVYFKKSLDENIPIHKYPSIYGVQSCFNISILTSSKFIKHFDFDLRIGMNIIKSRPSLVYTRNLRGALLACLLQIPTVLELHTIPKTMFNKLVLKYLNRTTNCKKIVLISHNMKTILLKVYPELNADKIQVAHDAVDLDRFTEKKNRKPLNKAQLGLNPSNKTACYVGHLYEGRGIDLIVQLATNMENINFLIIGGNPSEVQYRQNQAKELGIANLVYIGFINNSDLPSYYDLADVLLMPYENQVSVSGGGDTSAWMSPMKTYEYMITGKPIISSDLPALREVLNHHNSILVSPNSVEDWQSSIENALTNLPMAHKISETAKQEAKNNTWDSRVNHILKDILP